MGRKKSLSKVQRDQIVALHNEGLSEHEIAAKLKLSKTAVHQSIKKFKQYGSNKDLHRSGRPRKTHDQRWAPHEKNSYEVTTEFY